MVNTPQQAVAKANSITRGYGGLCLQFVRTCFAIPAKYGSAREAWNRATTRHAGADLSRCPVGAPLFLDSAKSKYGHVAIYMGNGQMRTTNSATNRVSTVSIASWLKAGYWVLGWTQDLNGHSIPGLDPLPIPAAPQPRPVLSTPAVGVRAWQHWLRSNFPAYRKQVTVRRGELIDVDNLWGPQSAAWTRVFQARTGVAQTGVVDEATLAKARALGFKG